MRNSRRNQLPAACALAILAASGSTALAASIGDVFVIGLENHNWTQPDPTSGVQQLMGNPAAPYINSLIVPNTPASAQVSYASDYYGVAVGAHPSEGNYVWSEAGTDFGVHTDNDPSAASGNIFTAPHLAALMNANGITWNNYQEDVQFSPSPTQSASGTSTTTINPYYGTGQYGYAVKHNPMAFFSDTATENVKTFDQLRTDITNDTFARYNWITPNLYDEMHSALDTDFVYNGVTWPAGTDQEAVAEGDNFLSQIIPAIQATNAYKNNGAIIIWFDETEGGDTTAQTIPEIILSPLARGNDYASTVEMNHSSDLKTMQEIFGLGPYLDNPIPAGETNVSGDGYNTVSSVNDLSDLFLPGVIPTEVPEPASVSVLAIAVAGVLMRRRRGGCRSARTHRE